MEKSKEPSLDKVLEKLEGLDLREWQNKKNAYGPRLIANIGPLKFFVFKWEKYHQISISDRSEKLFVEYFNVKKNSIEELKISTFYNNLCKRYEEHYKEEFKNDLKQVFSG